MFSAEIMLMVLYGSRNIQITHERVLVVGQFEMKNKEIVLIEWVDSKGMERWEYLDEIKPIPPCVCLAVGFMIEDNKDYKTLALGLTEIQVLGRTTIPSGCIKSIKKLTTSSCL